VVSSSTPKGALSIRRIPLLERPLVTSFADAVRYGSPPSMRKMPRMGFGRAATMRRARWQAANADNFRRSLNDQMQADAGRLFAIGHLWLAKIYRNGDLEDFGLAGCRVVTDTGVAFIVDAFQNLVELELMHFHGVGTGTGTEAASDVGLGTELTTQYSTSGQRPSGTLVEKAGDSKTFETGATITVSAAVALTEHGVFSTVGTGTGVLLDRTKYAAVNLAIGESLQATYQLTFPSGGA
jgi:hypothetical protein